MTVLCVYDVHHYFVNIFTIDGTTIQYIDSLHFRYQKCLKIGMRPECVNLEFKQSGPKRTHMTVRKRKTKDLTIVYMFFNSCLVMFKIEYL